MANDLLSRALKIASEVHSGQFWRDGQSPFLSHPLAVSALVLRFGGDDEQAAAALVHDTIADARGSAKALEQSLTPEASRLAHAFSDPEIGDIADWRATKLAYLEKLRALDPRALLVIGCEELHEITDLLLELRLRPRHEVWARYPAHAHAMNVAWYFKEVLAVLNARLKDARARGVVTEMALRVRQLNEQVFEGA